MAGHTALEQAADITLRLKLCKQLPTLPAVALRLVELANDESASLDEFAQQITFDPALAGKLLRVANSSFYGRRRAVTNLLQAMSLLGLSATIALSLSFSLRATCLSQQCSPGFDAHTYWRRALLTALACRTIAEARNEVQPEDFLLAGLLQDIGILAMDAIFGSRYAGLHGQNTDHQTLLAQEALHFGFTHAQAAAHLLKSWGLPERICRAAWLSHELMQLPDEAAGEDDTLPRYVAASAVIADAWMTAQADTETIEDAYEAIDRLLGIRLEQYRAIITTMIQKMPEMEALFETQLADPQLLRDLEYSAQEALTIRDLSRTRQADPAAKTLESRVAVLEEQTQRDALTGLYNRSYMDAILQHEFERATRENTPLSIAFIDVDHFKAINDTFGHAVGDQVLAMVARRLQTQAHQMDTIARYGGEEFVVLLPETRTEQASLILQRMLAHMRDTPFRTQDGAQCTITFSAGIATHWPGGHVFRSAPALLQAADSMLYQAKEQGRGRITVHRQNA